MKMDSPDSTILHRGLEALQKKRESAKTKVTIRLDEEVVEQFKHLVPEGRGYQSLINQALREWLAAQGVKELVREELVDLVGRIEEMISLKPPISKASVL